MQVLLRRRQRRHESTYITATTHANAGKCSLDMSSTCHFFSCARAYRRNVYFLCLCAVQCVRAPVPSLCRIASARLDAAGFAQSVHNTNTQRRQNKWVHRHNTESVRAKRFAIWFVMNFKWHQINVTTRRTQHPCDGCCAWQPCRAHAAANALPQERFDDIIRNATCVSGAHGIRAAGPKTSGQLSMSQRIDNFLDAGELQTKHNWNARLCNSVKDSGACLLFVNLQ